MKYLAIIPARSGSKGLKNKNIKLLNKKPLLAYTIEAALQTKLFDEVMVSTDSNCYADIAKSFGANVPFLRTEETSKDNSSTWDVVREVLNQYKKINVHFDICVLLQPTSPFRTSKDIIKSIHLFQEKKANTVVSVCEYEHPVQWCFPIEEDNSIKAFADSPYRYKQRQEIKKMYHENGAIYIVKIDLLINQNFDIYQEKCFAYEMTRRNSIDIDIEDDFVLAEYFMKLT